MPVRAEKNLISLSYFVCWGKHNFMVEALEEEDQKQIHQNSRKKKKAKS